MCYDLGLSYKWLFVLERGQEVVRPVVGKVQCQLLYDAPSLRWKVLSYVLVAPGSRTCVSGEFSCDKYEQIDTSMRITCKFSPLHILGLTTTEPLAETGSLFLPSSRH